MRRITLVPDVDSALRFSRFDSTLARGDVRSINSRMLQQQVNRSAKAVAVVGICILIAKDHK